VKCIDHGQLLDEPTVKLMAEKGIWWSLQPFIGESRYPEGSPNRLKQLTMFKGTDTAYQLAKKYHMKTAWGSDILFSAESLSDQTKNLTKLLRWYTPSEILKMATADNAELLALSGERSPYAGKLGVIEEGALADILLIDGDPIANIRVLEDADRNISVIMKDGKLYKNAMTKLSQTAESR
jgi:imidazolonepropionase-like amidohydrolase